MTEVPGSIPRITRSFGTVPFVVRCIPLPFTVRLTSRTLWPIRWGIFVLACAFLYAQLTSPKGIADLEALRDRAASDVHAGVWVALVLLMVLNWGLESAKWRWLVAPVEEIGGLRAFLATLAGTSVGLVTPNRTGEFLGRVLFLSPDARIAASFATALGSIAQFVITLLAGGLSLVVLLLLERPLPWPGGGLSVTLVVLTAIVAGAALVLFLSPGLFRQLLLLVPFLRKLGEASGILSRYARHELVVVLLLSLLRYVVFTVQFVLMLLAFDAGLRLGDALLAVPLIYLVTTLVPTVMLTELGVRGSVSLAVLGALGGAASGILLAAFTVWLVNLVLPAVAGSVVLLVVRIRTRRA